MGYKVQSMWLLNPFRPPLKPPPPPPKGAQTGRSSKSPQELLRQCPVCGTRYHHVNRPIAELIIWTLLLGFIIGMCVKEVLYAKATSGRDVRSEPAEACYPDFDDYAEELKECAKKESKD